MGGWVSLFEENTSGALGGAPDTTPNDNCDRSPKGAKVYPPPPLTMFYLQHLLLDVLVGVLWPEFHTRPKE